MVLDIYIARSSTEYKASLRVIHIFVMLEQLEVISRKHDVPNKSTNKSSQLGTKGFRSLVCMLIPEAK